MNREKPTLDEVHDRVRADEADKWDVLTPRCELTLHDGRLLLPENTGVCERKELTPTSWATMQLCQRLGIPTAYFRRCPAQMRDAQANYWLQHGSAASNGSSNGNNGNGHADVTRGGKWLLRANGKTLRGVLSEHYSRLDNTHLLDSLRPMLNGHYQVDWFGLSDEALHLRVIDPRLTREVLPDDALSVGIHLSNSEVGLRAVTVDALVYRLVCTNGLIRLVRGKSLLKQRHIHIAQPRFVVALEEAVSQALQTASGFVEQMRRTTQQPIDDIEKVLEKLGERHSLSANTQEAAKRSLLAERHEQQNTVYGLVNGLTRAAQTLPDENRYDLEVLAGRLADGGLNALLNGAPKRRKGSVKHPLDGHGDENQGSWHGKIAPSDNTEEEDDVAWSPVEMAARMFEAEIVSVVPHRRVASGEVRR